jgi:hypothetical protein
MRSFLALALVHVQLVLCFLLLSNNCPFANAFVSKNNKKREAHTRPAFQSKAASDSPSSVPAASSTQSQFAFRPASSTQQGATSSSSTSSSSTSSTSTASQSLEEDDWEDEVAMIGYTTAIISCMFSIALGFGLGYGV